MIEMYIDYEEKNFRSLGAKMSYFLNVNFLVPSPQKSIVFLSVLNIIKLHRCQLSPLSIPFHETLTVRNGECSRFICLFFFFSRVHVIIGDTS